MWPRIAAPLLPAMRFGVEAKRSDASFLCPHGPRNQLDLRGGTEGTRREDTPRIRVSEGGAPGPPVRGPSQRPRLCFRHASARTRRPAAHCHQRPLPSLFGSDSGRGDVANGPRTTS